METVRDYSLERLAESGKFDQASAAYARYFLMLSEEAGNAFFAPDEVAWFQWFAAERDNLRGVLAWSLDRDVELGLRIAGALRRYLVMDGHYSEWRSWIDDALTRTSLVAPRVRSHGIFAAAWLVMHQGILPAAIDRCQEGLVIARALGDLSLIWVGVACLGLCELARGDASAATALFEEGLDICGKLGEAPFRGGVLYCLGLAMQMRGDYDQARERMEEAVEVLRAQGERYTVGSTLRSLGGIALSQGDYDRARARFQEGLRAALVAYHREGVASALEGIAGTRLAKGDLEGAARLRGAADAVHDELHGPTNGDDDIPFARLPHVSPHLRVIATELNEPRWKAARDEGYRAPVEQAVDDALEEWEAG